MTTTYYRKTLQQPITVSGIGIHTGSPSQVTLTPAEFGSGIVFRSQGVTLPATTASVVETSRCTVLGKEGVTVSTVEHLLSACAGLGITDLIVEIEGAELPIGDGSSLLWCEAITTAGIQFGDPISPPPLSQIVTVADIKRGTLMVARPAHSLRILVHIAFEHPLVGAQTVEFAPHEQDYTHEIGNCRTFGFIEEVEALLQAGLAKGGSFENAVVVYPDHYSTPLRHADELARHKVLDVLGDLMLIGHGILPNADIIAVKPSHRQNVTLSARLADVLGKD
jgi:UDP-3-O-[3-hydroxymyristoyl] N-acetylglucosamine deacetylase